MKKIMQSSLIENRIFLMRGQKVMLSNHLAELYSVEVRMLVQAVKRNMERFPKDFMFQLSWREAQNSRSQIGVGSIKSVDDVSHCSLIVFVTESEQ